MFKKKVATLLASVLLITSSFPVISSAAAEFSKDLEKDELKVSPDPTEEQSSEESVSNEADSQET